jgi:hypothetical protein
MSGTTRSRATTRKAPALIFQLKVTLEEIEPPIWRRLLMPSDITLAKLHPVLQEAMGWTNSHLHQFVIRDRRIRDLRQDEGELGLKDEKKVKLDQVVGVSQSLDVFLEIPRASATSRREAPSTSTGT